MYAKIPKSNIGGKKIKAIFYDNVKIPIKAFHFGAESYDDYIVAPHDEHKNARYEKKTLLRIGGIVQQPAHSQDIFCGPLEISNNRN